MLEQILIGDADKPFIEAIKQALRDQDLHVITVDNGLTLMRELYERRPDSVLVAADLPQLNGLQICRRVRDVMDIPVIIVSNDPPEAAEIEAGLKRGASHYLPKETPPNELAALIQSAIYGLDDTPLTRQGLLYADNYLQVDLQVKNVIVNQHLVELTQREREMLLALIRENGKLLTPRQLLNQVWGPDHNNRLEYVRVYVQHLRNKLEPDPRQPIYIINQPRRGYRFSMAQAKA